MINILQTYNAKITILLQISQPDSYIMQNYKLNQDNISFLATFYKKKPPAPINGLGGKI